MHNASAAEDQGNDRVPVREILAIRDFRLLWLGQIVSNFGDSITRLAALFLVNDLTDGSTTAIALVAIAQAIPHITIGLVAGVYVDRLDRKRIMIVSDVLRGFLVFGLIWIDSADQLWFLYLLVFLLASASSFFMPARTAYIPLVVPKRALLSANSLSQIGFIVAGVAGAAFAGWSIGSMGAYWPAFSVDALTFFASAAIIARVLTPSGGGKKGESTARAILEEMMAGFHVLASSRVLLGVLGSMAVAMLGLGMVNVLLVPLVVNDLNVSETWFAALQLAQSVSMILSGAMLAVLAARVRSTHIVTISLLFTGIAVLMLAQVSGVAGLILILFFVGWFMTPLQSALMTLLQNHVTDALRGRAGSALNMAAQTASVASMAGAGLLAGAIGTRNVFLVGGGLTMAAAAVAAAMFRGQPDQSETLDRPDAQDASGELDVPDTSDGQDVPDGSGRLDVPNIGDEPNRQTTADTVADAAE